ncbi:FliG C-terminal domain-containing protein [Cereibacter sp. SYSU M97828]|nr:FliG C-terminal domain-containing protein [Cereibacter flavus]
MSQALAQITPTQRAVRVARPLNGLEKAAIVVRLLISEGANIPLSSLPEELQAELTAQMGQMTPVDRATMNAVIEEFSTELEQLGLAFPGGMEGALKAMDGHISAGAVTRLRRGGIGPADPWERLNALPPDRLLPILEEEAVEVAAVMLSKLPVARSAELLGKLPGDRARKVAFAVSMTGNVDPATVQRIGASLAQQIDQQPPRAFDANPVERVGAILNVSQTVTREDVLTGLDEEDADFGAKVRRAIFTFSHIPAKIAPAEVPKLLRAVDQAVLITAMAAPGGIETREFILANLSQRMAQTLREEVADRGTPRPKDAEAAMSTVIGAIRQLEGTGEITLITED